ncbi:hypothetical protein DERP_007435 [Dermatophagoides pteronyssinus]|uniref:Uncharacterized protein n=1 Tax=Dermatophagoides pteronyssinus TaxID=6956 RepID=A0ABQ8J4K7_DERPT|nr:hypothetical protein DERP_007435 [Dermatophagoides pteronyssinus]
MFPFLAMMFGILVPDSFTFMCETCAHIIMEKINNEINSSKRNPELDYHMSVKSFKTLRFFLIN